MNEGTIYAKITGKKETVKRSFSQKELSVFTYE